MRSARRILRLSVDPVRAGRAGNDPGWTASETSRPGLDPGRAEVRTTMAHLVAQLLPIAQQGGDLRQTLGQATPIIWLVAFAVIFYFLLIRPQRQQQKRHEAMLAALRPGDKVVTQGGLVGTITKTDEGPNALRLKLAPGVEVTVMRSHIATRLGEEGQ